MFAPTQNLTIATEALGLAATSATKSRMAWTDSTPIDPSSYLLSLSKAQTEELMTALEHFKLLGIDGSRIAKETFVLPTLGPQLEAAAKEIHFGCGFFVVRGLQPDAIDPEDIALLFLGISSYIGEDRAMQDSVGNMLVHIRHEKEYASGTGPTRFSNKQGHFHNDKGVDMIGMFVCETASTGGETLLASVEAVVQSLKITHPEVVEALKRPEWNFGYKGPLHPAQTRAVLYEQDGRTIMDMSMSKREIVQLPAKQQEALAILNRTSMRMHIEVVPHKGDVMFLNNRGVLHSRKQFFDSNEQGASRRHYMRLHLRNQQLAWSIPAPLRAVQTVVFETRAGIEERWAVWDSELRKFMVDIYDAMDSH